MRIKSPFLQMLDLFSEPFETAFGSTIGVMPNIVENEDNTGTFAIPIPGVKEENLTVEVKNQSVFIKAFREDKFGSFKLDTVYPVPIEYVVETVDAKIENGMLFLTFQKNKEQLGIRKKVTVKVLDK